MFNFLRPIPFVKKESDIKWGETAKHIQAGLHIEKRLLGTIPKKKYTVHVEEVTVWPDIKMVVENCYTQSGLYLGDEKIAKFITEKLGLFWISSTLKSKSANVGAIVTKWDGFAWYGWSARGICRFGRGDKIFVADGFDEKTPFKQHGYETIENMEQGKEAAINFANYIA